MESASRIRALYYLSSDSARMLPMAALLIAMLAGVPLVRTLAPLIQAAHGTVPVWEPRLGVSFISSLWLAATAGVMATLTAGVLLPLLFHPREGRVLSLGLVMLFCLSPVVLLQGFQALPGFTLLSPFGAAAIVMSWKMVPIAVVLLLMGIRSIARGELEAGRLAAPVPIMLWRLILPRLLPALLGALAVTFVLVLADGELPGLVGYRNLPEEVLARITIEGLTAQALLPAIPMLLLSLAAAVTLLLAASRYTAASAWLRADTGAWRTLATQLPGVSSLSRIATALILLPFILLGVTAFPALLHLEGSDFLAVFNSAVFALAAASLAALLGYVVAEGIAILRSRLLRTALLLMLGAQWMVPGYLLGAGIAALAVDVAPWLDGDRLLVITHALRTLPFAALAFLTLISMDRRADSAAELAGIGWWWKFRRLRLPVEWPFLGLVVALVGVLLLSELASTLMVVAPGTETAVLRMYNLMHYGAGDRVAGLALLQSAAVIAVLALNARVLRRRA